MFIVLTIPFSGVRLADSTTSFMDDVALINRIWPKMLTAVNCSRKLVASFTFRFLLCQWTMPACGPPLDLRQERLRLALQRRGSHETHESNRTLTRAG